MIFDDTIIEKTGKVIEGVSKVWDHTKHLSVLGFQLLVMGLYDGKMFIPINFSIHRSKGSNKKKPFGLKTKHYKKQFNKKRDQQTNGYKRKKELDQTKIQRAVKMIKEAVKRKIVADYVLTDSWFTCWEMVKTTIENNMNYLGVYKNGETLFTFRDKELTSKNIRHLSRASIKRSKRFRIYYVRVVVNWNGQQVVLFFTRKGKRGNWKTILCTDLSLTFNKAIEIYQIRWTIEVFFKDSKQSLGLGKSQSNDFDAQIADITLTMIRYHFLSLRSRIDNYETMGELFRETQEQMLEIRLHERIMGILIAIIDMISEVFDQSDDQEIMLKAINNSNVLNMLFQSKEYIQSQNSFQSNQQKDKSAEQHTGLKDAA